MVVQIAADGGWCAVHTTHRSAGRAHGGSPHQWLLATFLLGSSLLVADAVVVSTRNPSNLLFPLVVGGAANALLLCPALRRGFGQRCMMLAGARAALSSRARWSSWTATGHRRRAGSVP